MKIGVAVGSVKSTNRPGTTTTLEFRHTLHQIISESTTDPPAKIYLSCRRQQQFLSWKQNKFNQHVSFTNTCSCNYFLYFFVSKSMLNGKSLARKKTTNAKTDKGIQQAPPPATRTTAATDRLFLRFSSQQENPPGPAPNGTIQQTATRFLLDLKKKVKVIQNYFQTLQNQKHSDHSTQFKSTQQLADVLPAAWGKHHPPEMASSTASQWCSKVHNAAGCAGLGHQARHVFSTSDPKEADVHWTSAKVERTSYLKSQLLSMMPAGSVLYLGPPRHSKATHQGCEPPSVQPAQELKPQ